jgi:peroxiredoxin
MTQLVELQEALPKFEAAGIKLYAVSYDEVGALAEFAHHHDIKYPLLSDVGSKVIDRFGIRNHFVTKDQIPYYGIPFPGTYLVDEQGIVSAKFFQRNLAQRESAEAVIDSALGEILLGDEEPHAEGGGEDIRITATHHGGGGKMKSGVLRQVVVRFELAPGLHIYGEPVPDGMVATKIRISGPPGLHVGETIAPPTHALTLPGLDAELRVWDGRVDFAVPVYVDDRIASLVDEIRDDEVPIEVQIDYQGCDDSSCRIPQRETITLRVPLAPHVGNDLAGELAGTIGTTMSSRWFMLRMIWRAWLQSPIRGLRYLLTLWLDLRRGPAARRHR